MNYLAPLTLLAALISTAVFFNPAVSRAAMSAQDNPLESDIITLAAANNLDSLLADINESTALRPPLQVMTEPQLKRFEFITLPHVFFGHNSIALNDEARQLLDGLAQYVIDHDSTINRILIHGNANALADVYYNYRLSDQRAYAIWDYLASKGIEPEMMSVSSRGELNPIDQNWTREGRQRNRFVEIQIVRSAE